QYEPEGQVFFRCQLLSPEFHKLSTSVAELGRNRHEEVVLLPTSTIYDLSGRKARAGGEALMRCSKCGAENPSNKKFCGECGTPLANLCPKCRADNLVGKRFCGECGTALGISATVASADKSGDSPIRVADAPAAGRDRTGVPRLLARA